MPATREHAPLPIVPVALLTAATLATCVWIALTVNLGTAAIAVVGVAAALWLFVNASRDPETQTVRDEAPPQVAVWSRFDGHSGR